VRKEYRRLLVLAFLVLFLSGCNSLKSLKRERAVPGPDVSEAEVVGVPGVRYNFSSKEGVDDFVSDFDALQKGDPPPRPQETVSFLTISGGGDKGAFSAGLLSGWTKRGDRPEFKLVTGISTGALIAPFAFLGSDYDDVLRLYTTADQSVVFNKRGFLTGFFADGLFDTAPLYQLISELVDEEVIRKIAHEYSVNHRWLLIATTNLDAQVPIKWNMGKLASVGTPEAIELFRKVILASASIPGAFPPVMIDVEVNGDRYQEMHVDGGASRQVFLYPAAITRRIKSEYAIRDVDREVYIIRNGDFKPKPSETDRFTVPIVLKTVKQLLLYQGIGDLFEIYVTTQQDNIGYNLAFISSAEFDFPRAESFSKEYMSKLFDYAEDKAANGYPWFNEPFGLSIE